MIHFGTGGWRAVIGDEFTRANVRLLTQGLAHRILQEGTAEQGVVIGYDRRFLSDTAAWWAIEVLVGNSIRVTLIDRPSPTPTTMWTVRRLGAAYGMAVTASHNPALYNGIKIFLPGGRDADQAVTDELTASLRGLTDADVRSVEAHEARSSELVTIQRSINWYLDAIIDKLDTETIRHAHMHIVLDPMFGVSETSLQTILLTARCQVDVIHDRHDPLFGGRMPSPTEGTVTTLRNAVVESGADLGIATDGDADRLGIIDDTGAYLTPNQVLVLLYDYLLTRKGWSGPAVRNMSTTHLLDRVAAAHGQVCYEVPVGFKWISAKMAETGAVIGGESSGGLTVRGHIPGKDGVYAGSLLVEAVAASGKRLSELYADIVARYGELVMVENAYGFTAERRAELQERIFGAHDLPAFTHDVERVSWEDGCKVYFTCGGWLTIRFSGTEPLLRVFAEMPTGDEARATAAARARRALPRLQHPPTAGIFAAFSPVFSAAGPKQAFNHSGYGSPKREIRRPGGGHADGTWWEGIPRHSAQGAAGAGAQAHGDRGARAGTLHGADCSLSESAGQRRRHVAAHCLGAHVDPAGRPPAPARLHHHSHQSRAGDRHHPGPAP